MDNTSPRVVRIQRVAARLVPSTLLLGLVLWTLVGPNGARDLYTLSQHAEEAKDREANLEKANTRLLLDLQRLQADPINLERLAADQLGLVRPGTTLYAFDEQGDAAAVVPSTTAASSSIKPVGMAPAVPPGVATAAPVIAPSASGGSPAVVASQASAAIPSVPIAAHDAAPGAHAATLSAKPAPPKPDASAASEPAD